MTAVGYLLVPGSTAAASVSVANANLPLPQTDPELNDLQVAHISCRPSTVTIAPPAGWIEQSNAVGTDGGSEGADTGSVRKYIFTKLCDGTEGVSNATFVKTGTASVIIGDISNCRSATGTYDIAVTSRSINADTVTWGATETDIGFQEDDLVFMSAAQNGNVSNTSGWNIAQAGLSFSTRNEIFEYTTITGNDAEIGIAVCNVNSGTGSGNVTTTITQSVACSGVVDILRIRQGAGVARSDVWLRSAGIAISLTSTGAIPYPTVRTGDMVVATLNSRDTANVPDTPVGWNLLDTWVGGAGAFGADAGNARTTIFYREASSSLTGTQTFTITLGTTGIGRILSFANGTGRPWRTPVGTGAGENDVALAWSQLLTGSILFPAGGIALVHAAGNNDVRTLFTSPSVTAPGVTFSTAEYLGVQASATGNDAGSGWFISRITAGATATPTVGLTWNGTVGTSNPAGAIGLIVLAAEDPAPISGAASLTGSGSLVATGSRTLKAQVALTGFGLSSVAASRKTFGLGSLAGSAEITATGKRIAKGSVALTGGSNIVATGRLVRKGSALLTGSATTEASGSGTSPIRHGFASILGAAIVTATGRALHRGSATLTGEGYTVILPSVTRHGGSSITGVGSLVATGRVIRKGIASLTGSGGFTADARALHRGSASLTGSATLEANGTSGTVIKGASDLTGEATLIATGRRTVKGAAFLIGSASFLGTPNPTRKGQAALTANGDLSATGGRVAKGSVLLTGVATILANSLQTPEGVIGELVEVSPRASLVSVEQSVVMASATPRVSLVSVEQGVALPAATPRASLEHVTA